MRTGRAIATPARAIAPDPVAALMRGYLVYFLPWVFRLLHPGEKPLRMHWYLWAMCQAFQKTAIGRTRRLVVNVPPRHLKSITATAFAAWMLGHSPSTKIMIATYGDKLGSDHLDRLRLIMSHPFYKRIFPVARVKSGGSARSILAIAAGGGCRVVTVGGATTGFGADIILIDDAMKAEDIASEARRLELDRFYRGTLLTRLNSKLRGIIVSIQQRLGEDDLPARLLESGAEHLCLPAYDDQERLYDLGFGRRYRRPIGEVLRPDDEPMSVLERHSVEMGRREFAIQYLQQPGAAGGNAIRVNTIPRFDLEDVPRSHWDKVVLSCDTASSEEPGSAYSVILALGFREERWHLFHVTRERFRFHRLRDAVLAANLRFQPDLILVEEADSGRQLIDDLRYRNDIRLTPVRPEGNKVTRMVGQLAQIKDGVLAIPHEAPWLDDFLHELRMFPTSRYMDQIDSLSQFLEWARRKDKWIHTQRDPVTGRKLFVHRRQSVTRRSGP